MLDGKNITSSGGTAVGFGDKIDMNSNKIINVPNPTDAGDAANKTYVDLQISNVINGAPGALDTLNELANALGDDANFSTTVTNNIAANAADIVALQTSSGNNATALATAQADIITNTTNLTAETNRAQAAEQANAAAIQAEETRALAAEGTIVGDMALKASITYVDSENAAQTTTLQSYADTAEADAISTANAYTDTTVGAPTTDDVAEGSTNLYYTDARVDAKMASVAADIHPDATETRNLGSADKRWNKLFLKGSTIDLGGVDIRPNRGYAWWRRHGYTNIR